jgi:hypothetical protein
VGKGEPLPGQDMALSSWSFNANPGVLKSSPQPNRVNSQQHAGLPACWPANRPPSRAATAGRRVRGLGTCALCNWSSAASQESRLRIKVDFQGDSGSFAGAGPQRILQVESKGLALMPKLSTARKISLGRAYLHSIGSTVHQQWVMRTRNGRFTIPLLFSDLYYYCQPGF